VSGIYDSQKKPETKAIFIVRGAAEPSAGRQINVVLQKVRSSPTGSSWVINHSE